MSSLSIPNPRKGRKTTKNKNQKRTNLPRLISDGTTWSVGSSASPASKIYHKNKVYTMFQSNTTTGLTSLSVSVPVFATLTFKLNQMYQDTQLGAIFDQYRIAQVECWIIPRVTPGVTAPTEWGSVIDFDDATNLGAYGALDAYETNVTSTIYQGHYRRFIPHIALAAYSGSAFTDYANATAPWLDCSSDDIPHYGIKMAFQTATSSSSIDVHYRFMLQFRNVR